MKHLLNDLSEEVKNSIREQHTGGMKVVTENFSKLLNTKSGSVKLVVNWCWCICFNGCFTVNRSNSH
jgi:hypothetical protein